MRSTHDKLKVLREGESEYGQHTLEGIVRIIDAESVSVQSLPPALLPHCILLTQRTSRAYPGTASTRGWGWALVMTQGEKGA